MERRENVPGDIVLGVTTIGAVTPARTCSSARVEKAMSDSASEQSSTERFQVAESFGCARPWGRSAGPTERSVALMPMPLVLPSFVTGEFSPALHGRVHFAKYQVGLASCLSWFIHPSAAPRQGRGRRGSGDLNAGQAFAPAFRLQHRANLVLQFGDQKMPVVKMAVLLEVAGTITRDRPDQP